MELQQLCRALFPVDKDLIGQLAAGLLGTRPRGVVADEVVADEAILSLLVAGAGWVTLGRLLWRRNFFLYITLVLF